MRDAVTQERITVLTDGDAGPYIMVPVAQVGEIAEVLRADDISHWVDQEAISLNGQPEVSVINLGRNVDVAQVQRLLDARN